MKDQRYVTPDNEEHYNFTVLIVFYDWVVTLYKKLRKNL